MPDLPPSSQVARQRIASLDILRGLAIVLMALDHVRVFSGVAPGGPTPGVFFTRWVTHFCAPAFFFLAGTSAFLYRERKGGLTRYLCTRGVLLVVLELTVLRFAWSFNGDFGALLGGVIWALGWCMILLAGLVRLPTLVVGLFGLVVVGGHNLFDVGARELVPELGSGLGSALWKVAYIGFFAGPIALGDGGAHLMVLYSLVPWIGVMALGFAFGSVVTSAPARRDRLCLALGAGAIALFLVLRGWNLYGDPRPWGRGAMPALLAFLNTTKYPASLAFLLMTLGPLVALVPLFERLRGWPARFCTLFGREPLFAYLVHIPLIHALALVVSWAREGRVNPWLFASHPMEAPPAPEDFVWSLALLYGVWLVAVVLLALACRAFAELRERRPGAWMRYL